jgi:hypothetical protein
MAPAVTAVTAAALATSAAVVAATACWLALCRLAAWWRRRTRVAGDFSPPDPPKGDGRKRAKPYVAKGGHGGARPGAGMPKGTSQLRAQRGLARVDEPMGPLAKALDARAWACAWRAAWVGRGVGGVGVVIWGVKVV